jgi:uncharacterized protein DUF6496
MPDKKTRQRARKDARQGKSPSTQAGEFVHEEIRHVREGKHGARSPQQAIAIGLSKARRAGVKLPSPKKGKASAAVREHAKRDLARGRKSHGRTPSAKRSRATSRALRREGSASASHTSLSRQAHSSAVKRGPASRHRAARKAVRTKGPAELRSAARKAARTRARHGR